jgi:subtilisin
MTNHRLFGVPPRTLLFVSALCMALLATTLPSSAFAAKGGASSAPASARSQQVYRSVDRTSAVAPRSAFDAQRALAAKTGTTRVIVGLQTTFKAEGALSAAARSAQRAGISQQTASLLASLKGTRYQLVHSYSTVPYVALKLSTQALDALQRSGKAASLQADEAVHADLAQSGPLVEAPESWAMGRAGAGRDVAILDTGVQSTHPFLQQAAGGSKVVSQACFSANATCPGGVTQSFAAGSGEPCTYASGCIHGTHVAGIAAGRGAAFSGVARDANLVSINIFSNISGCSPCSFTSDQIAGLDRVNTLSATLPIASVNMSLGGGSSATNCDTDARKPIIDTLRSKGIAVAIASGNDGFTNAVSFPACISSAITVGSTDKSDVISSFSNSSPLVELLAPGTSINSSVPGGGFAVLSGTSMATPHVAGAWAVMKGISPGASVDTVLSALQMTGKPVTDTRPGNPTGAPTGVVKPRIRLLAAGTRLADTGLRGGISVTGTGVDMASDGIGMAHRVGAPASGTVTIGGIPAGATVVSSRLIWTTIGGPDPSVVFRGVPVTGVLTGASRDTCWNINQFQPNRTYMAPVSVPGNGTYTLSGVGGVSGADGQGASLVVIYRKASGRVGRVYLRYGASTSTGNGQLAYTFLATNGNGVHVRRPAVHVGVGDGQAFTEDPLTFAGTAITSPNFFSGVNGTLWDDARVPLSTSLIGAGPATKTLAVKGLSDCLVLSYAGVSTETTG